MPTDKSHFVAIYARLGLTCFLVLGFLLQFVKLGQTFVVKDQRVVQILKSVDGLTTAELTRRHSQPDLTFIVELNGRKVYTSPPFAANYTVPFRETLMWDRSGRRLILEIAGRRFFGYDVAAQKALSSPELQKLQVDSLKPEALGLRGQWPPVGNSAPVSAH